MAEKGNIPASKLTDLDPKTVKGAVLDEIRFLYLCETCNRLGIGTALESLNQIAMQLIATTKHAKHLISQTTEKEFYRNWEILPRSANAKTILYSRERMLEADGVIIFEAQQNS